MRYLSEKKIAVVTGGCKGIGRAITEQLLKSGIKVVIADIDYDKACQTVIELNNEHAIACKVDVTDETQILDMYSMINENFGKVDFLINNAAIMLDVELPFKPFWEIDWQEWKKIMDVNVGGVYLCCKHAKPLMERAENGRVINISSDAIWKGYESQLAYFASKGAVAVMTRNLARELGPFNINVNAVAPGYTLSESVLNSKEMQEVEHLVIKSQCLKIKQEPKDIAGAVSFLCSPESRCITGQTIVVNCGAIMP